MMKKEIKQLKLNNIVEPISTRVVQWKIYSGKNYMYWSNLWEIVKTIEQRYFKDIYFVIEVYMFYFWGHSEKQYS